MTELERTRMELCLARMNFSRVAQVMYIKGPVDAEDLVREAERILEDAYPDVKRSLNFTACWTASPTQGLIPELTYTFTETANGEIIFPC